jgi:hypothetical protein
VATVESKVETIDSAFASYRKETDARLDALQQELVNVKISANNRDKLLRMKSVKLSGFPVSEEERSASDPEKFLAKRIYDKILVPVLSAAKEDGALDSVPTLAKTIEVIRRINTWSPPSTSGSVPGLAPKEKAPPSSLSLPALTPSGLPYYGTRRTACRHPPLPTGPWGPKASTSARMSRPPLQSFFEILLPTSVSTGPGPSRVVFVTSALVMLIAASTRSSLSTTRSPPSSPLPPPDPNYFCGGTVPVKTPLAPYPTPAVSGDVD